MAGGLTLPAIVVQRRPASGRRRPRV